MSKPAAQVAPPPRSNNLALWILIVLIVIAMGGAGAWWFVQNRAPAQAGAPIGPSVKPARYYALEPAFVVNLADADSVRYLQADVQVMTRDEATGAALELHAPAVRNRLLLLFGQQSAAGLAQRSAKERLQERALTEVRAVLKRENAADKVEAVYFTSLVTQ